MLTLTQLCNLGQNDNIDIFSGFSLPNGSPLDRDTIINSIIERCGLNIPMYADPVVMRSAITLWSAKNQYTFIHIGKIYNAEYSPIENTDKYDSIIVERSRDMADNTTGTTTKTESAHDSFEEGYHDYGSEAHSGTDTSTNTTSALNSSTYEPDNKNELAHGESVNTSKQYEHNTIDNASRNANTTLTNGKQVDEDETTTTTQHTHGNIGVTTNTTLQVEEYKLMADYNPYDFIAGLFENELTLCVY